MQCEGGGDHVRLISDARRYWDQGEGLIAGELLMSGMSEVQAARMAFAILRIANKFVKKQYLAVFQLMFSENRRFFWRGAHSLFYSIRRKTLKLERKKDRKGTLSERNTLIYCYLLLAECAAKTVYNACDPMDPFDEDSSAVLIAYFSDFVVLQGSEQLKSEATALLFGSNIGSD